MNTVTRPITALMYPRGTYKAQTIYFRGDDIHKEPEFLDNEYRAAKLKYDRLKIELDQEKQEFEKVQAELAKREGYTVTLASALGDDSKNTEENARLRQQIVSLQAEIDKFDAAIAEAKEQQHPGLLATLQKERAFYNAEIEDLRIAIFTGIENIEKNKQEIAELVKSDEYTSSSMVKSDRMAFQKFYNQLRSKMDKQFSEFSAKQSEAARARQARGKLPGPLESLCYQRLDAVLEKEEVMRNKDFAELRKKLTAQVLIDQIETMNQAILALHGEPTETEQLKDQYAPESSNTEKSRDANQEDVQTQTRPTTKSMTRTWKDIPKPRARTSMASRN